MRTHHRTTPRRLTAAAITLTALLGLAACGEELIEPKPLETLSSSPTPTKAAAPEMPDAATKHTKTGAIAFVKHFVDVMTASSHSGATERLRDLYRPACHGCEAIADLIDKTYESGGNMKGGGWTITRSKTYGFDGDVFPVDVEVETSPQTVTPRAGATPTNYPGGKHRPHFFVLQRTENGWLVQSLDAR